MIAHESKELKDDSEISLLDILVFLKSAWRAILIAGILGSGISSIYLILTPNQYEAVASIQMARIPAPNDSMVNIEEPAALIARMSLPNSFDMTVMNSCGMENQPDSAAKLSKVVKLAIPKGATSLVELKVTLPTPELAKICATNIVELIETLQAKKIGAIQKTNEAQLIKINERLVEDKILLTKALQSGTQISPTYFSLLSDIRNLEDQREKISTLINGKQLQESIQKSPVYVADKPIYPKKAVITLLGLFGGLFFGLLAVLARKMIAKLRVQFQGAL